MIVHLSRVVQCWSSHPVHAFSKGFLHSPRSVVSREIGSTKPTLMFWQLESQLIKNNPNFDVNRVPVRRRKCISECRGLFSFSTTYHHVGIQSEIRQENSAVDSRKNWIKKRRNSIVSNIDPTVMKKLDSGGFDTPRTSMLMEITDRVGVLHDVLRYFWKYDVNICRIESRPSSGTSTNRKFDFFVDMEGSFEENSNIKKVLDALIDSTFVDKILILDVKDVNWFPWHISEIDLIANRVLDAGEDLQADHPGFLDPVYRERRAQLAKHALEHTMDQPIARIEYTESEISVWTAVWDRMENLWDKYACTEYIQALQQMKHHCGYSRSNIPQQQDISNYLHLRTGFRMRPVAGLLSSRDFLNALAFRVFCSTQYIRHSSMPLYTPEPDIIHELLGHAPMLADPDFADFSQEIGLASLGASDEEVAKLARCYWFSVEFGLCKDGGEYKAYGAGLLSSFGELEFACNVDHPFAESGLAGPPEFRPWDPEAVSKQEFPITTYQPLYFVADSLMDAKQMMRRYCEDLPRPFFAMHNEQTDTVHIDRPVQRTKGDVPVETTSSAQ